MSSPRPRRRIRFRPPGVKPWTRIGPLGPFRGRLGLSWVVAPLVLGGVLGLFAWLFLFRSEAPGGSFVSVGTLSSFPDGRARGVALPGVFVGVTRGRVYAVLQEDGCSLQFCRSRYLDCRGAAYGLDGQAVKGPGALDLLPVIVHGGIVYVDPDHPLDRTPAPAPTVAAPSCP
jgi:hypothetical protein